MAGWRGDLAAITAALMLAACGSAAAPPAPAPEVTVGAAEQAILQARAAAAPDYAPAAFRQARDKLDAAEAALARGDRERARRLAVEAQVDAELAEATAEKMKNTAVLRDVERSLKALGENLSPPPAPPVIAPPGSARRAPGSAR